MTNFEFLQEWLTVGNDKLEYRETMARLSLYVGNVNLMRNEDIWSRTIQDSVLISTYPLAIWLASSWWRLNWEPLPPQKPCTDWRMAHELNTANHGFIWPRIIFATDSEVINIWAIPACENNNQSVKYLNGLTIPTSISLTEFQNGIKKFINTVLNRLDAVQCPNSDLWNLWNLIQEDSINPENVKYRRIEAEMGFEPDECPEENILKAIHLEKQTGITTLSELTPVYGKIQNPFFEIDNFIENKGLIGTPSIYCNITNSQEVPWKRAIIAAEKLREKNNLNKKIENTDLYELLGIRSSEIEQWIPYNNQKITIAIPSGNQYKFILRKKHPIAKRFELARLIADYIFTKQNKEWLTSTDMRTSRQKYQKAFAAEFLCPIKNLQEFLQDNYSESKIEDAAEYFQVSTQLITAHLINNELIGSSDIFNYSEMQLPYQLTI